MTKDVQIVFKKFLEQLAESVDEADFREVMASAAAGLEVAKLAPCSLNKSILRVEIISAAILKVASYGWRHSDQS